MEWIEVRAASVEEAVERALDALGVHEDELEVVVVATPRRGLLGFGRGEAHIRARVKPLSREKPVDRRRRRGRDGTARDAGSGGDAGPRPARRGQPERGGEPGPLTVDARPAPAPARSGAAPRPEAATTPAAGGERPRRRRGGRGRRGSSDRTTTAAPTNEHEEPSMPDPEQLAEAVVRTRRFVTGLLEAIDMPGDVLIETGDDRLECRVEGEGLGALVGVQGATLAAVEELLRDAVGYAVPGIRLHLDIGGYRARRRTALSEFAIRLAQEVASEGSAKALEPMPPGDRKVVHDAVSAVPGVATTSEGEEPRRRVVIRPV